MSRVLMSPVTPELQSTWSSTNRKRYRNMMTKRARRQEARNHAADTESTDADWLEEHISFP